MEKRSIDNWLPSIDSLTQAIEKVILFVQGSYVSLQRHLDQVQNSKPNLMTLDDAIKKRKEDLKYYTRLLSSCQNSMKTKLQISQSEIFTKMDDIDMQIMNMDRIFHSLTEQTALNECIHKLSHKIEKYNQNLPLLKEEIHKAKNQLKSQMQIDSEYKSYISAIQQIKQEKKKISKERSQIASQKMEFNQMPEIKIPSNKPNLKMKKALNSSISKLRILITNIDREITDTEKQKSEMRLLIKESQNQYIELKKCINETVSKTTKKTMFITNVVDEMKNLIQIRRDRSALKKEMIQERQHFYDFQNEIKRINSKIESLKAKKQKLINDECEMEEKFLKKAMPKKRTKKKGKNDINKVLTTNNDDENEYSNDENKIDHELIIDRHKDIKEKQKNNLKLLKKVESENADIISLRQKIREAQENIVFQTKLKKETESLRKERENHSIFFSFEKIQNQIEEKKANIEKLKRKIKEEKEFLSLYSQLESIQIDSDD
ncbi:hypothetical protein M9Y10_039616 [Tritrichomonas musculus]|uniref:DUF4709 domain-containing protein n=1 Tax=Tritrichomonas musculus TaxID=1915356 RepID=A0ABR2JTH4_9EUKA